MASALLKAYGDLRQLVLLLESLAAALGSPKCPESAFTVIRDPCFQGDLRKVTAENQYPGVSRQNPYVFCWYGRSHVRSTVPSNEGVPSLTGISWDDAGCAGGSARAEGSSCGLCCYNNSGDPQTAHDGPRPSYARTLLDKYPERCSTLSMGMTDNSHHLMTAVGQPWGASQ